MSRSMSLCVIAFFLLVSCGGNVGAQRFEIPEFPNPVHRSMRIAGPMTLISRDTITELNDTLFFDSHGRLNRREEYAQSFLYAYNEKGYLIRQQTASCLSSNSWIENEISGDTLIQTWFHTKDWDWKYENPEFDRGRINRWVKYLIEDGVITKAFWDRGGIELYTYDAISRLIKREYYIENEKTWSYQYQYEGESVNLLTELMKSRADTIYVRRFKGGILYSEESEFGSEYPTWQKTYEVLE